MTDRGDTLLEARATCLRAAEALAGTPGGEPGKAAERLRAVADQLEKTAGLFFVKTKASASFLVTLGRRTRSLEDALAQVALPEGAARGDEDWQAFLDELDAVENEANVLHAKATTVQQMMIT